MKDTLSSHDFWGFQNPLLSLSGVSLIIMASGRTAYALIALAALLWVYGFSQGAFFFGKRFFPKFGEYYILLFITAFVTSFFLLILCLTNPLLALETFLFIILAAPCYIGTGLAERCAKEEPLEALFRALREALTLGLLILAFSLIREPLGEGSVSLPGSIRGIFIFGGAGKENGLFPIRLFSAAAGGFLLLGYGIAVFKFFRNRIMNEEDTV